jgi:hypothetical protein
MMMKKKNKTTMQEAHAKLLVVLYLQRSSLSVSEVARVRSVNSTSGRSSVVLLRFSNRETAAFLAVNAFSAASFGRRKP